MADTEITMKEGTLTYPPMRVKVESGTREDGTKYEVHQHYAPPTFLSQVTDSKGRNAETRLNEMQTQIDGATTEIEQTVNDVVTQRAREDIATKEEVEALKSGVVDADTVDGYHMSDYFQYPKTAIPNEADLNTYLTPGVYRCTTLAVAKTLLNAPAVISGFKLIVKNMVGSTNLIQYAECVGKIFFRTLTTDLSNVQPWRSLDDYLPLTGGMLTGLLKTSVEGYNGFDLLNTNVNERARVEIPTNGGCTRLIHFVDDSNLNGLQVNSNTTDLLNLIQIYLRRNGVNTIYNILHTGCSNPVSIEDTAPADTTALWVDTENKRTKAYIDGAWTNVD